MFLKVNIILGFGPSYPNPTCLFLFSFSFFLSFFFSFFFFKIFNSLLEGERVQEGEGSEGEGKGQADSPLSALWGSIPEP